MAITKKSIIKPTAQKTAQVKAPKTAKSSVAPAGKMETTMRVAKTALLARSMY